MSKRIIGISSKGSCCSISLEENKAVVRKMIEAINKQNLASLDKLMASDFVLHMHTQQTQGWKANRQVIEDEIKAFPDLHVTIEDIIAEGDKVCVRLQERQHTNANIVE